MEKQKNSFEKLQDEFKAEDAAYRHQVGRRAMNEFIKEIYHGSLDNLLYDKNPFLAQIPKK